MEYNSHYRKLIFILDSRQNHRPSITLVSAVTPVIVQPTGQFHGNIVVPFLGVPEHVLDDATPLDPRDDVFDHHADARYEAVVLFFLPRQLAVARLLLRLVDGDIRQFMTLVGGVPIEVTTVWECRPLSCRASCPRGSRPNT
jgi:hypothetical protein